MDLIHCFNSPILTKMSIVFLFFSHHRLNNMAALTTWGYVQINILKIKILLSSGGEVCCVITFGGSSEHEHISYFLLIDIQSR